jgi:hypothetical protein
LGSRLCVVSLVRSAFAVLTLAVHSDVVKNILTKYFEADHCGRAMIGALVDGKILNTLVAQHLPDLKMHCKAHKVNMSIITMPMFITMFVNTLPSETAFRAWDRILFEGPSAIFDIVLNLLSILEQRLLDCNDDASMLMVVLEASAGFFDPEPAVRFWHSEDASDLPELIKLHRSLLAPVFEEKGLQQHTESVCLAIARNTTRFSIPQCKDLLRLFLSKCTSLAESPLELGATTSTFADLAKQIILSWSDLPDRFFQDLFRAVDERKHGSVQFAPFITFLDVIFNGALHDKAIRTLDTRMLFRVGTNSHNPQLHFVTLTKLMPVSFIARTSRLDWQDCVREMLRSMSKRMMIFTSSQSMENLRIRLQIT